MLLCIVLLRYNREKIYEKFEKMPSTLQDVADAARVSMSTVSKVLNNRYDVSLETVELVESAIRQVGYQRVATRRGRDTSATHPPVNSRSQQN